MKYYLHFLTPLFISFISNSLIAQSQLCFTGGGPSSDQAHTMVQANDGGYVTAGQTVSYGAGLNDIYVIKTNAVGTVMWTQTVGGIGNDYGRSIIKTFDGGYAIAGTTASFGAGGDDLYLVKLDAGGNVQWNKSYGGTGTDQGWEVVQTPDSGFCIAGQTASFGASPNDFYVVRTDALGNLVWDKKVGAAGLADIAYSITNTNDGGFAVAGTAYSWTGSASTSSNDFYIVKLDGSGNMVWSRLVQDVNTTKYPDYARSIIQTADGGYMVAGEAGQPKVNGGFNWHYLLVKLDPAGAVSWTRYYGGTLIPNVSTDGSDYAETVIQMPNGDYLVGGYTFSFNYNFNTSQQVGLEYYLIRVSGTGGLISTHIIGTAQNDFGKCLIKTNDGGYMIAGYSQEITAGTYPDEFYLVKLDGSLNTCCTTRTGGADRGTGPTNTTRGVSAAAGGTVVTGGLYGSGGTTTVICGLTSLTAAFQTNQAQLCQTNNCVNFTDISSGSPTSWSWSFPGAIPATSNVQNPSNICYNNSGTYPVTLVVGNGISFDTLFMSNYITLSPAPSTPVITASGPSTFCSGDTLFLTSSYPLGNTWVPNGLSTQVIAVTTSGPYSVTYTDANGCQASSLPIVVTVNPTPSAPIVSPSGPLIICADGSIQLYSNVSGGNNWSPNSETTDTIWVVAAGSYFVTNTVGGCISQPSNVVVANVGSNPLPPTITQSNDTLFSSPAASYQWYLNGIAIPGATSYFHIVNAPGSYTVFITNEDGCGTTGEPFEVTISNSLMETNTLLFEVYPNPTNQSIHVLILNGGDFFIQVRDLQGKLIQEKKALNKTEIDLTQVESGIYFVSVFNLMGQNQTVKVIKLN
jgi:PKD repeat protein